VVDLDRAQYRWAMVIGPDRDYFWILARDKTLPADVRQRLLARASELGIAVDRLIWVSHDRADG
jgi:apolipoprotein D and lipocalin family protein